MSDVDTGADAGASAEATAFSPEAYATQFGWKPKDAALAEQLGVEAWKGDESKWTDAADFLKHTFDRTKEIAQQSKKRMEDNNRINARLIEAERKKAREAIKDAERRIEEAAADGDTEGARAATQDLRAAERQGKMVEAQEAFRAQNPWFGSDKKATRIAQMAAQELIDDADGAYVSPEAQFKAALKAVREEMPELFEEASDDDPPEPRQAKKAPNVVGGTRTPPIRRGPKGWDDIPAADRKLVEKAYINSGRLTKEEYAKTYWSEKGEAA